MKYIDQNIDFEGKKVLLRLDLNLPILDNVLLDTYRIEKIIPTIDFLKEKKAQIIIISHIEDKEGNPTTLLPVFQFLKGYFEMDFSSDCFSPESLDKLLKMKNGDILLFENLRKNIGEKENNEDFAKKLSNMADIYVNDAFSVCHRNHASIVSVPKFLPSFGGLLLKEEIKNLSKAFDPQSPFLFILGGVKFETKIPLLQKFAKRADEVFVGGALSNNFFKAKNFSIGKSLVSEVSVPADLLENPKIILPIDVTVQNDDEVSFKKYDEILEGDIAVDIGPKSIEKLKEICQIAKTIIWNGPMGNYEIGFSDKTEQLAEIISNLNQKEVCAIVGGGDTLSCINKLGIEHKFTFVSTGGGAMLDFLLNETLPGILALG